MKKQELIEKYEHLNHDCFRRVDTSEVLKDLKQLDEPETGHADEAPRYVKNILARLRELPLHDREVWLKAIMGEFERDFSHAKWREGYEQGKFEGMLERDKVTIPQFVADWIEECKNDDFHLFGAMEAISLNQKKLDYWFREDDNMEVFARAWLDGYEVEKEPKYTVKIKGINGYGQYLNKDLLSKEYFFASNNEVSGYRTKHTKKQLEDDGFGWVFDCPGIKIEEVTE